MFRLFVGVSFVLVAVFLSDSVLAQDEPKKKPEPEVVPEWRTIPTPAFWMEPGYQRPDTRDVWAHYGVNSFGRFVPRVINTPFGYYYSRDLQPYPWAGSRPRAFLP